MCWFEEMLHDHFTSATHKIQFCISQFSAHRAWLGYFNFTIYIVHKHSIIKTPA